VAAECTNFPHEVVEMALAHTIESKVGAACRRGDLFQKRRKLMEAGAYCLTRRSLVQIVPISGRALEQAANLPGPLIHLLSFRPLFCDAAACVGRSRPQAFVNRHGIRTPFSG
jgi:hypothetical protein